jgi:N,N'-diacetyllegionaminate synthase
MSEIQIADRVLGEGHPAFIAAEIGINHNGDMQLAHQMIDAAADAGADAVKFQNYRVEDFVSDRSLTYTYESGGKTIVESQWEMFKRCELDPRTLVELREHCDRRRLVFFSTPTGDDGVAELVRAGGALIKNGSDYLGNLQLIRTMARTGLPTVLSTGMATVADIDAAVRAFRGARGRELILLVCTSAYPTPAEQIHLRRIPTLARVFGCPVGFSDHSEGVTAAVGAVALGACFVEKHFTLDRTLPGPDHRFSSDPNELRELVRAIRFVERALGSPELRPTDADAPNRDEYRLSCVAARDLPIGHVLGDADIAFQRPGHGLPPSAESWLRGARLARPVVRGHVWMLADFKSGT